MKDGFNAMAEAETRKRNKQATIVMEKIVGEMTDADPIWLYNDWEKVKDAVEWLEKNAALTQQGFRHLDTIKALIVSPVKLAHE